MTRTVALRANALFILMTLVLAAIGVGSDAAALWALLVVGIVLVAMTAAFALVTPDPRPVLVPVRRRLR